MEENKPNEGANENKDNTQTNVPQQNNTTAESNQQNASANTNQAGIGTKNNSKTIAILSYITLIGWIIALIMEGNENPKTSLAGFHLRQSLGIMLTGIVGEIVLTMLPFIGWILLPLFGIGIFILWILGLISAINGEEKPVVLLGDFYQKTFSGIR